MLAGLVWLFLWPGTSAGTDWLTTIGGTGSEDSCAIIPTRDNGYLVAGNTNSFGAGYYDVLLAKLDPDGNVLWQKTYGGTDNDYAFSVRQTSDNGSIVIGRTESFGAGQSDVLVLKLDPDGNIQWQKVFGGPDRDWGREIIQTTDGGYFFCGHTLSSGAGNYDFWMMRLSPDGSRLWERTLGGTGHDIACSTVQTSDGGYAVAGYTSSAGAGKDDILVVKLDDAGVLSWQKTYGTVAYDGACRIQQLPDRGYVLIGRFQASGDEPAAMLLRLNENGVVVRQERYAGTNISLTGIQQSPDGDFVLLGSILNDILIFKTGTAGEIIWQHRYGGTSNDMGMSICPSGGDGYAVSGRTYSFGAGSSDMWIQQVDESGNISDCDNAKAGSPDLSAGESSLTSLVATLPMFNAVATVQAISLTVAAAAMDVYEPCLDRDSDGVADDSDNCPDTYNPGQSDVNGDGTGDACSALYDTRENSFISLNVSPQLVLLGEEILISGSVIQQDASPLSAVPVTVTVVSPSGIVVKTLLTTLADGMFEMSLTPDEVGGWSVIASWEGNSEYKGSHSVAVEMTVGKASDDTDLSLTRLDISSQSIVLGEEVVFQGEVKTHETVPVFGALVQVLLISPRGRIEEEAEITTADGVFDIRFVPDEAGIWTAIAAWGGDAANNGSHSKFRELTVEKADVDLTLNLSASTVMTDRTITVEGYLLPRPLNSFQKTGMTVFLNVTGPDSDLLIPLETESSGRYTSPPLDIFSDPGDWTLRAVFAGNDNYLSSITDAQLLEVLLPEETGYAVIIHGRIESEEGIESHRKSVETVYAVLRERNLREENIRVFGYGLPEEMSPEIPLKENIGAAVTDWAAGRIGDVSAPLYLVFIGHGSDGKFFIYPEVIEPADLDAWARQLEAAVSFNDFTNNPIYFLIGSCGSGSFIPEISAPGRVVISSSAAAENAYRGPLEDGDEREGAYFITAFFKRAARGNSMEKSFDLAADQIAAWTEDPSLPLNYASGFFDKARQHPLIDDNGDGEGHHYISPVAGEDGSAQPSMFLGTSDFSEQLEFVSVSPQIVLGPLEGLPELYAVFNDALMVDDFWLEIKIPGYRPLFTTAQYERMNDFVRVVHDPANSEDNTYYFDEYPGCDFTVPGKYEIFYFARDLDSRRVLPFQKSVVYRKLIFNFPPSRFDLIAPADQSVQDGTTILFDWADSTDFLDSDVTYSLLVSDNETFSTLIVREDQIRESAFSLQLDKNFKDGTTYYWKVEAIDSYGEIRESNQVWRFYKNAVNIIPGTLSGYVYNAATGLPLPGALITSNCGYPSQFTSILGGFSILASAGSFDGQARAFGFSDKTFDFELVAGKTTFASVPMKRFGDMACVAERTIQNRAVLDSLRRYRDTVLLETAAGRTWVETYYAHSDEITGLLAEHPDLRRCFLSLVFETVPQINRSLKTRKNIRIRKSQKKKIRAFLRRIEKKSSPELKMAVRKLNRMLK